MKQKESGCGKAAWVCIGNRCWRAEVSRDGAGRGAQVKREPKAYMRRDEYVKTLGGRRKPFCRCGCMTVMPCVVGVSNRARIRSASSAVKLDVVEQATGSGVVDDDTGACGDELSCH